MVTGMAGGHRMVYRIGMVWSVGHDIVYRNGLAW